VEERYPAAPVFMAWKTPIIPPAPFFPHGMEKEEGVEGGFDGKMFFDQTNLLTL
jgi:hypothetical protein